MSDLLPPASIHLSGLLELGAYSHRGRQRSENEDAFSIPAVEAAESSLGTLLAVADGVGGRAHGKEASAEAVHYIQALYYAHTGSAVIEQRLGDSIAGVNALNLWARRRYDQQDSRYTTLIAAVIHHNLLFIANVGDSRAYLIKGKKQSIEPLTEDHSESAERARAGWGSAAPADENTGVLTRGIGFLADVEADLYEYTWEPGDYLVLMTDGLQGVPLPAIAEIVTAHPPQLAARELVNYANRLDGSDNSTVVIAHWQKIPNRRKSQTRYSRRWLALGVAMLAGILIGALGLFLVLYWITVGL